MEKKKVLIVGLARTGVAVARFMASKDCEVTVTDIKEEKNLSTGIEELKDLKINYEFGKHTSSLFKNQDLIVISPGVPLDLPAIKEAKNAGVEILGDVELAWRYLKVPIIAITGTNGKSTVTTLVGQVLNGAGKKVFVGGNIGDPIINAVGLDLNFIVAEISSFQMEAIKNFRPWIGVLLNLAPDHLDRYKNAKDYYEAKCRVFENQTETDFAVVNWDNMESREWVKKVKARIIPYSIKEKLEKGAWWVGSEVSIDLGQKTQKVDIPSIKLPGLHNKENALATLVTAAICGCELETIRPIIQNFAGLEHRIEFVRTLDGVDWYNDSKGTNIDSVLRAIEGFSGNIVWIAGGRNKKGDFRILDALIKKKVKYAVLLGEAASEIAGQIADVIPRSITKSMKQAVEQARLNASPGDTVLFSPGCASFDMFTDYEERGRVFKQTVRELNGRG